MAVRLPKLRRKRVLALTYPCQSPWSRPHWLMAYRLRAPHSMAHTASPNIAPKGCRLPWALRGSGTRPNTSINDQLSTDPSPDAMDHPPVL